ncbi:MAG: SurA N-terminal domain-containing protein [Flammeovirgaceae bacterium]|nr:SurA N-terminal domain-containing protein [Flammeovirgaceae bacterium]
MTIINKIRDKSGLLFLVIGVAMLAFILGDLFSRNYLSQNNDRIVGTIAGEEITFQQFSNAFETFKNNYESNVGRPTRDVELPGLRQQAWQQLVFEIAYSKEFEKLGIQVTPNEMTDMIQGNNINPAFGNLFVNQETGEVDRGAIKNFLASLPPGPPTNPGHAFFLNFEANLRPNRLREKYEGLINQTYYATEAEAKREYESQNTKADIRYVYVPYTNIPDSTVDVSEGELKTYYDSHKDDFKRDATISLDYVTFPITPTAEDIDEIKSELDVIVDRFASTQNDSIFIDANSETNNNFQVFNPKSISKEIEVEDLELGKVVGPIHEGDFYRLYKVIDITEDSVNTFARASHILIKADDTNKAESRSKAQDILNQIKNGADFAEMAQQYGEDGTKAVGGDLGWFDDKTMVAEFNDAVMNASSLGLIPKLIETQFGFHIISVTGLKNNKNFLMGVIEKEIVPSDDTRNEIYRKTTPFGSDRSKENFMKASELDSSIIRYQALNINKEAQSINNIYDRNVRTIITWAFREAEVDDVSEILELEDQYIIALITGKTEDGIAEFEDVKDEIKRILSKDKKKEELLAKIGGLSGTVDEIRQAYGPGAIVSSATDISLSSTTLGSVGFAPVTIGTVFSMAAGESSGPIADENGVLVVEVDKIDEASELAEYSIYKQQLESAQNNINTVTQKISSVISEYAEVENELYKYY